MNRKYECPHVRIARLEREVEACKWAYGYLQDRMRSVGRHGWAEDCDGEIEARIGTVSAAKEPLVASREEVLEDIAALASRDTLTQQVATLREALETVDVKAQAGLCQMTHGGAREFLKDIRRRVVAALAAAAPAAREGEG